ncbi:MAG: hypothetical protein ACTSRS_12000 [Candidatus Helarchaeota archaeon]
MTQTPKKPPLKHVETKKQEVKLSEAEKALLEKYAKKKDELELTPDEATVLDILKKRKTLKMVVIEVNLARKPLGQELKTEDQIEQILLALKEKNAIKSVIGADGQKYWVDIKYYREKLFGTERL